MQRESFSLLYFMFLINEVKEFRQNINALRRRSIDGSKVDAERSPLKFFSVNIRYHNLFTLEPDLPGVPKKTLHNFKPV